MVKFTFNIEPVAQARPRATSRPYPHLYDPKAVKVFKVQLHSLAVKAMEEANMKPLEGALDVRLVFYRPIQKSISKKEHARRAVGALSLIHI